MLNTGIFLDLLKIANISPIYKKMTNQSLVIIDQYHCFPLYPKYLKKYFLLKHMIFFKKKNSFIVANMDLEMSTQLNLQQWKL